MGDSDSLQKDEGRNPRVVRTHQEGAKASKMSQPGFTKLLHRIWYLGEADGTIDLDKVDSLRAERAASKGRCLLPTQTSGGDLEKYKNMIDTYRANRGDKFTETESKLLVAANTLLESISNKNMNSMKLREQFRCLKDIVGSLCSLNNQARLEEGKSTSNNQVLITAILALQEEVFAEREAGKASPTGTGE